MDSTAYRRRVILGVRLQSSTPAKIAKLRNTMTCPAMSLQHPAKSRCSHAVSMQVPIGESRTAAGAMNSHAHHGAKDERLDGEERLIRLLSRFRSLAFCDKLNLLFGVVQHHSHHTLSIFNTFFNLSASTICNLPNHIPVWPKATGRLPVLQPITFRSAV